MERKPLIKLADFTTPANTGVGKVLRSDQGESVHINFEKSDLIKSRLGIIVQGATYHYYCRNEWGLHDVVIYIAQQIGPCKLYFCTWSIGNEAIILLDECRRQGLFSQIWGILSTRVRHSHPDMYNSACSAFDRVVLDELHAKVAVLENDAWTISVFGSSNMTLNPRIERNAIVTDKAIASADKNFLEKLINEKYAA